VAFGGGLKGGSNGGDLSKNSIAIFTSSSCKVSSLLVTYMRGTQHMVH
jgi:hypothetical protein